MLFRTVYGPELEAIYSFIATADTFLPRSVIHAAFIPQAETAIPSTQNVDDALSFLESAGLVETRKSLYRFCRPATNESFRIHTLRQLRALELGQLEPVHPIDPLYMLILTEIFIQRDQFFVADVHNEANKLRQVTNAGGLSQEKIQAWKRVMEFLGVGRRVLGGFQCVFMPDLLLETLDQHLGRVGVLQTFLEENLTHILPYQTERGDLAQTVQESLCYLEQTGQIALSPLHDSPSKPYFGDRKIKQIVRQEIIHVT